MRNDDVEVKFEMELRPRKEPIPSPSVADYAGTEATKVTVPNEVVYTAHIYTRYSDHHAEGPTLAMALVDAALHWERYERGRR